MYSFYFGILPILGIETMAGWTYLSAFLIVVTGFVTSICEITAIKKNNMTFTSVLAFSVMLGYLLLFGIMGAIVMPSIWLATHVLIVQTKQG